MSPTPKYPPCGYKEGFLVSKKNSYNLLEVTGGIHKQSGSCCTTEAVKKCVDYNTWKATGVPNYKNDAWDHWNTIVKMYNNAADPNDVGTSFAHNIHYFSQLGLCLTDVVAPSSLEELKEMVQVLDTPALMGIDTTEDFSDVYTQDPTKSRVRPNQAIHSNLYVGFDGSKDRHYHVNSYGTNVHNALTESDKCIGLGMWRTSSQFEWLYQTNVDMPYYIYGHVFMLFRETEHLVKPHWNRYDIRSKFHMDTFDIFQKPYYTKVKRGTTCSGIFVLKNTTEDVLKSEEVAFFVKRDPNITNPTEPQDIGLPKGSSVFFQKSFGENPYLVKPIGKNDLYPGQERIIELYIKVPTNIKPGQYRETLALGTLAGEWIGDWSSDSPDTTNPYEIELYLQVE